MEFEEQCSSSLVPEYQDQYYENEFDLSSYFSNNDNLTNDNTSMSSFTNKKHRRFNKSLKTEAGSYVFKRVINDIHVKIQCFSTKSSRGAKIRSATTGIYNDLYVGKSDENLFFKVRVVNGEAGSVVNGNDFYYDSPEEYERHMFVKISQKMKETWDKKFQEEKLKRQPKMKNVQVEENVTIIK